MNNNTYNWGQKKHDRTISSALFYWLSKLLFNLAPSRLTRFMREKGFSVKPYLLSHYQNELWEKAYRYDLAFNHNKIRVYEWGSGPVILLVHGWAGRGLQLDAFVEPLLKNGFKVVTFDHKGHGDSTSRFSSFPEMVRSTRLVTAQYADTLHGVVAHSIGSNSFFKTCETIERKIKIVGIAPMENFLGWLEKMRMRIGIDENLFAQIVHQIETECELSLSDLCALNYEKIKRHEVLLVHDKFDRMNKINASFEIQKNIQGTHLLQTEKLGHSRILANQGVVDSVKAFFLAPL